MGGGELTVLFAILKDGKPWRGAGWNARHIRVYDNEVRARAILRRYTRDDERHQFEVVRLIPTEKEDD